MDHPSLHLSLFCLSTAATSAGGCALYHKAGGRYYVVLLSYERRRAGKCLSFLRVPEAGITPRGLAICQFCHYICPTRIYFGLILNTWQTTFQAQTSRGCQVIATKNMRLFCHENGLKPHISV